LLPIVPILSFAEDRDRMWHESDVD
jgi:hypothetical protein